MVNLENGASLKSDLYKITETLAHLFIGFLIKNLRHPKRKGHT